MDKYYSQIIGSRIVNESGQTAGHVCDIILNADTGKVVGFITHPGGHKVLSPMDILVFDRQIQIHDSEDILETSEIHQVAHAIKHKVRILKNRVETQKGAYLGQVRDFSIHDKLFTLTGIVVSRSFLGIIFYDKKIINSKDIIEIKKDKIIVKDPIGLIPIKKLSIDAAPTI